MSTHRDKLAPVFGNGTDDTGEGSVPRANNLTAVDLDTDIATISGAWSVIADDPAGAYDMKGLYGSLPAKFAGLASAVEAVTAAGPRQVFIRSFETYAEKLGLKFEEVVKSTPLLIAGTFGDHDKEEMCAEKESEEMLRVWLDSYHVRGSFDDRTLVVLYREEAA